MPDQLNNQQSDILTLFNFLDIEKKIELLQVLGKHAPNPFNSDDYHIVCTKAYLSNSLRIILGKRQLVNEYIEEWFPS